MTTDLHGRRAYAAYGNVTGNRNYQGLPMPSFDDLGELIQRAWISAAEAAMSGGEFRCEHCGKPFGSQLDRIEHKIDANHAQEEKFMSEIDDKLDAEDAALTGLEADEQRELADLTALQAQQPLTADEAARFDALTARVTAADAAINAADPAPATPAPTDPGTGDTTGTDSASA